MQTTEFAMQVSSQILCARKVYILKVLLPILSLFSVFVITSCDYVLPRTWNYKITVEIDTPEGIKSGSSVRQVVASLQPRITPETRGVSHRIKGEAVVVDLGDRGRVFALINSGSYEDVYKAFPNYRGNGWPDMIKRYSNIPPGTKAELKEHIPQMVTFTDMDDPKSVKLVRGGRFNKKKQKYDLVDDFEEIFGQGVKFKRITIEITDDPVSWGMVDGYLPWLSNYYNTMFDGNRFQTIRAENKLANSMSAGSFKTQKVK